MPFPCLITVDKDINVPRLPSYILKKETADKTVRFYAFDDLPDNDLSRYGLVGSPTNVEKMFAPPVNEKKIFLEGSDKEKTEKIFEILSAGKFI
jgi:electron transfer flavoprotein beta subunit